MLAGAIGILAGVAMLSRRFTMGMAGEDVLVSVMGLIILLTGLMHIFGGFRTGPVETHLFSRQRSRVWPRAWSWTAFLLGLFEMILGLMLVIEPMTLGPVLYFAASIWALLGGVILIGDAVRQRRDRLRRTGQRGDRRSQEGQEALLADHEADTGAQSEAVGDG